jgi:pimeloyl-ACP methyl ester carboxylesterase
VTMLQPTVVPTEFDLQVPSGRIHAERFGPEDAPLALCIPGLSANLKSFDFLGERLASTSLQVVAIDLRGRGRSEVTPPGTYGWVNHARDVFAVADALGAQRVSLIGQSMGGAVAMAAAHLDAARIERIALLDIAGRPDESVLAPIGAAVSRLGAVYPSVDAYVQLVRQIGTIEPWSDYWQRYFEYELQPVEGGVASSTDRAAVLEDGAFGAGTYAFGDGAGVYALWKALTMPVLLLRASRELLPGLGHIVPQADRDRFLRDVPGARSVEVDANHYGINTHEDSARAIAEFLGVRVR